MKKYTNGSVDKFFEYIANTYQKVPQNLYSFEKYTRRGLYYGIGIALAAAPDSSYVFAIKEHVNSLSFAVFKTPPSKDHDPEFYFEIDVVDDQLSYMYWELDNPRCKLEPDSILPSGKHPELGAIFCEARDFIFQQQ